MDEVHVVTCFLEFEGKILVLKRSGQVGTYQQKWAGISGYLEEGNKPLQQAVLEINEETGLSQNDYYLKNEGEPLTIQDINLQRTWVVHPFRFLLRNNNEIKLDWEHSEYCWVEPQKIAYLDTVPGLYEAWSRVK